MLAASVVLAMMTQWADARYVRAPGEGGWIWNGSAEGARAVLSTVASSMITVAGVVFSITLVVFTMASAQFGPRLLRTFMRDLGNQVVLGTFVGTFLYCLLILRSVSEVRDGGSVPHVSVTCGLALAVASLVVLIYFIHHVCDMIQAENVVAHVGRELEAAIKETFPKRAGGAEEDGHAERPDESPGTGREPCLEVRARRSGYVQGIEVETLMELAAEHDLRVRLLQHPGNFVAECNPLARIVPVDRCPEAIAERVEAAFILGRQRTPTQDIDYSVHQLVEIGVRALSPGINDPYTALACIDWLGAAMTLMTGRATPSPHHRDASGTVRLTLHVQTFAGMMDRAFDQLRQYGSRSPAVMIRLLETFARVAHSVECEADLEALRRHGSRVIEDARKVTVNASDLEDMTERHRHLLEVCAIRAGKDGRGAELGRT